MASTVAPSLAAPVAGEEVSLLRLYILRAAYLLLVIGLGAMIVPEILNHELTSRGVIAALCLLAGLGDLRAALRGKLRPAQRISRHLWRMCFALFIATGSFFIGQQDVLPAAVRGSPWLLALGFAPFALMAFWLVRLRFAKAWARLTLRQPALSPRAMET